MADYDILLVNPPCLRRKPDYFTVGTPAKSVVETINPGILSIASYLRAKGFSVKIIDMLLQKSLDNLVCDIRREKPSVVGVSCTSGFEYLDALECARVAKIESPSSLCMAGGQHIGALGRIALENCKELDLVIKYEGEWLCEQILNRVKKGKSPIGLPGIVFRKGEKYYERSQFPPLIDLNSMPFLDFELYPNYKRYTPLVEESRGCPFACKFCASTFMYRRNIRVKKYERIIRELDNAIGVYGQEVPYWLLASTFGVNYQNTVNLAAELKKRDIRWRTELRVDCPWEKYLSLLYDSGFRTCNVGMESASPEILIRMGKTPNPAKYIKKASKLIKAVSQLKDLSLRFNMMMYIGETPKTLRETLQFLSDNASHIDSVWASTVFVYPSTQLALEFQRLRDIYKCELVQTRYTNQTHLYPCRVSEDFSFEASAFLCDIIGKCFCS